MMHDIELPEPKDPRRPKEWFDAIDDGLAIVVERGRIWHKNCPKDAHASGITGKISAYGADGLARIRCHHCGKEGFLPRGEGRIVINEIPASAQDDEKENRGL